MGIAKVLYEEGIKQIVIMPDSLISKCINKKEFEYLEVEVIQVLNELDAVSISSGLNLTGSKTICMMENSGIRSACDIISRFELAHGIHNMFVLSDRGKIGEENWWGVYHNEVTYEILKLTHMSIISVKNIYEFQYALHNAIKTFRTEQKSVAILLEYSFFKEFL